MLKVILEGVKITSREELFTSIGAQLSLPAWFGRNLDALHDVLTCDVLPAKELTISVQDFAQLKENLGGYADALLNMLRDVATEDSRLTLIVK